MQSRMSHDLRSTGFHADVHHTVTVHFESALLICVPDVSQQQEKQVRRADTRIRGSAHLRLVNDQG